MGDRSMSQPTQKRPLEGLPVASWYPSKGRSILYLPMDLGTRKQHKVGLNSQNLEIEDKIVSAVCITYRRGGIFQCSSAGEHILSSRSSDYELHRGEQESSDIRRTIP